MIRTVVSTIVERPMLIRSNTQPTKKEYFVRHIMELPNAIRCFRNAIVSVSRESKWCKLALLRNHVPVEIFALIQPFLIRRGAQDFYPSVACDQWVPHRKYLMLEAKLYRMELIHDKTLPNVRKYLTETREFRDDSKGGNWYLRQFNVYERKIEFIRFVLMLRFQVTSGILTEYDIEHLLQNWF